MLHCCLLLPPCLFPLSTTRSHRLTHSFASSFLSPVLAPVQSTHQLIAQLRLNTTQNINEAFSHQHPAMPTVQLESGISIFYEDSAIDHPEHASRPAVLFIHGLGMQLVAWPDPFIQRFIQRGFRVVRMDNRDIGLSSFLDHQQPPIMRCTICSLLGLPVGRVPYSLPDMADDAIGVLDACNIECAHVLGASMGGMIAQWMAVKHAKRVKSLTSIMSSTGSCIYCSPSARRHNIRRYVTHKQGRAGCLAAAGRPCS